MFVCSPFLERWLLRMDLRTTLATRSGHAVLPTNECVLLAVAYRSAVWPQGLLATVSLLGDTE